MASHDIITMEPGKRGGKPCIRDTYVTVNDVLSWLAAGMSIAKIVETFPELSKADIISCLEFAAARSQQDATHRQDNDQPLRQRPRTLNPDGSTTLIESQKVQPETEGSQLDSNLRPLFRPFFWMEKHIWEPMLSWGENQAFISLLGLLGNLGIVIATITYIGLEKQRREEQVYMAWQTITNAQGQSGNGGRLLALEFLNASPGANWRLHFPWICISEDGLCSKWEAESLDGVDLARAYLVKSQLPNASLLEANLQGAVMWEANLQGAKLVDANLQGAKLGGANLREAKLDDANLKGALFSDESTSKQLCLDITYPPRHPCPTQFPDGFNPHSSGMKLLR